MTITLLKREEAAAYHRFFRGGLLAYPASFRIDPDDEAAYSLPAENEESFTLVARNACGVWMGVVSFRRDGNNHLRLRHKGVVCRMYVDARYAGCGVGRALLAELVERARCIDGVEQLILTVIAGNERARRLYESVGFLLYGSEPRAVRLADGTYLDEQSMVMILEKRVVSP